MAEIHVEQKRRGGLGWLWLLLVLLLIAAAVWWFMTNGASATPAADTTPTSAIDATRALLAAATDRLAAPALAA